MRAEILPCKGTKQKTRCHDLRDDIGYLWNGELISLNYDSNILTIKYTNPAVLHHKEYLRVEKLIIISQ